MKTILTVSVLAVLLVTAPSPCSAMSELSDVSKDDAKAMGMEMRSEAHGPDQVYVELSFKREGELKNFDRVDLWILEGEKFLVETTLKEDQSRAKQGQVVVSLILDRTFLDKASLVVDVEDHPMDHSGYMIRVKDFVEPGKVPSISSPTN
jgi:hypothetical protein